MTNEINPGEARLRKRQRRQIIYLGIAAAIGGVVGFSTGFFDQGDGNLFSGDWEDLKLSPAVAIAVAAALVVGFLILPLYGFRLIDELKREQNLIGMTGGCLAVLTGFPVWAVLYAGGFTPPPTAFGIFLICFASMAASFLYVKWRA